MFKKIVVGLDGSENSENALRIACDLAKKYKSEIHLVHTPEPRTVAFAVGAAAGYQAVATTPTEEEVKEATEKVMNSAMAIAKECKQTIASTHTDRGEPSEEIIACAEKCGADLIVTGRRGLGSVGSLLQGSTTQKVNHRAKCACLSLV